MLVHRVEMTCLDDVTDDCEESENLRAVLARFATRIADYLDD